MRKINLLDCTLRDGGYINDWNFGEETIRKIINKMSSTGVEYIECGYLSTKNSGKRGVARYSAPEEIYQYTEHKKTPKLAIMINYGEYPIDLLSQADESSPLLRVAFHKKDSEKVFEYFEALEKLGYKYFVQPMGALNYTDEEYIELIKKVNNTNSEAFYIVDSFGVIEQDDLKRLLFIVDHNLNNDKLLGYHAHNNLQQAYSNAKYIVEQNLTHDILLDATVFGMGRGAGNLNIELFARYLNCSYDSAYNIEPILEIFDECLKPIFATSFWGYSFPFYLSSIHNCHPNYASFFADKNTLSVKSMHEILKTISPEDKLSFSVDKADAYYRDFQSNWIDDSESVRHLADEVAGREILILAPGRTLETHKKLISDYVANNNPIVFGVNRSAPFFKYNYLFINNEKRLTPEKPENVDRYIKTSNLHKVLENTIHVNYSSYLNDNILVSDDPTLMLIKLLRIVGVNKITIAGFDGFSSDPSDNYFSSGLSMGSSIISKIKKNVHISSAIEEFSRSIALTFLTPSKYIK